MADSVTDKPQRDKVTGRFQRGNTVAIGNKGNRRKLEEDFVADYCAAWAKHGPAVLEVLATKEPAKFAQVAASILPKHSHHTHERLELKSDAELAAIIAAGLESRKPSDSKDLH
jgi:hypothetical protein